MSLQGTDRAALYRGLSIGIAAGATACAAGFLIARTRTVPLHRPADDSEQAEIRSLVGAQEQPALEDGSLTSPLQVDTLITVNGFAWSVLWDYENVTPPLSSSGNHIVQRMRTLLGACRGQATPDAIARITVFCDVNGMQLCMQNELQASGVSVCHVPRRGRKEASDKALLVELGLVMRDHAPPHGVCLVSGDADFAYGIAMARNLGYQTAVIAPSAQQSSPFLTNTAHFVWSFPKDILAASISSAPHVAAARKVSAYDKPLSKDFHNPPVAEYHAVLQDAIVHGDPCQALENSGPCSPPIVLGSSLRIPEPMSCARGVFSGRQLCGYSDDIAALRDEIRQVRAESVTLRKHLKSYKRILSGAEADILRIQGLVQNSEVTSAAYATVFTEGAETVASHPRSSQNSELETHENAFSADTDASDRISSWKKYKIWDLFQLQTSRNTFALTVVVAGIVVALSAFCHPNAAFTSIPLTVLRIACRTILSVSAGSLTVAELDNVIRTVFGGVRSSATYAVGIFLIRFIIFVGLLASFLKKAIRRSRISWGPDNLQGQGLDGNLGWELESVNAGRNNRGPNASNDTRLSEFSPNSRAINSTERRGRKRKPKQAISTLRNPTHL
jgi:NYN domain